jgi:hypothetical protein
MFVSLAIAPTIVPSRPMTKVERLTGDRAYRPRLTPYADATSRSVSESSGYPKPRLPAKAA